MKGFCFQLSKLLGSFENCEQTRKLILKFLVEDLRIWKKCVLTAKNSLPIGLLELGPPISAVRFMSDAAGAAMSWTNGECKNLSIPGDRGVAAVGFEKEKIFFAGGLSWSLDLMTKLRDSKGRWWGCKSNALECLGLLDPA